MRSIFNYIDYREFLSDYFHDRISSDNKYSYRKMSAEFGFSGAGFIKHVIDKRRNLGEKSVIKISNHLNFSVKERSYFNLLAKYSMAKSEEDKIKIYNKINKLNFQKSSFKINSEAEEILTNRMCSIVILMIHAYGKSFKLDPYWISRRIVIEGSLENINRAILILRKKGFIDLKNGEVTLKHSFIETEDESSNESIRIAHKAILLESIDCLKKPVSEREFFSCTFTFSEDRLESLKSKVKQINNEFIAWVSEQQNLEESRNHQVSYSLNLQLYPVFKMIKGA